MFNFFNHYCSITRLNFLMDQNTNSRSPFDSYIQLIYMYSWAPSSGDADASRSVEFT